MLIIILILTGIGFSTGILIYIADVAIPNKVKGLEQTEKISKILPGLNCGACGYAGCFAYAQALTEPKALSCCGKGTEDDVLTRSPCAILLNDPESVKRMEKALGVKLSLSALGRKVVVHCTGDSGAVYDYSGVLSCKGAAQFGGGYKQCLYACLGLGDCIRVCPQNAISIDEEKHIVVIDREKCNGCGLCILECPQNLIELVPAATKVAYLCNYQPLRDIPGREKCDFGCTHCRKCFIACEEENIHAIEWDKEKARPVIDQDKCTLCGSCIKICPQNTLANFVEMRNRSLQPEALIKV